MGGLRKSFSLYGFFSSSVNQKKYVFVADVEEGGVYVCTHTQIRTYQGLL